MSRVERQYHIPNPVYLVDKTPRHRKLALHLIDAEFYRSRPRCGKRGVESGTGKVAAKMPGRPVRYPGRNRRGGGGGGARRGGRGRGRGGGPGGGRGGRPGRR